jgi:hypothetical protein
MKAILKLSANPYFHKTWQANGFKQVTPLPSVTLCHNPLGWFIEHGVHTDLWVIGVNFLIWDFGIMIYRDMHITDK